jgi:hypothetical protein
LDTAIRNDQQLEKSMFLGRKEELSDLENLYQIKKSSLIVIYGRRRIGKSSLIHEFCKNKHSFTFEGLEGEKTPAQIKHFCQLLQEQFADPMLHDTKFNSWQAVFAYMTLKISENNKIILFFDEFQWIAAGQSKLVSLIKYFWDNEWKQKNVMLILCGSIASFMINKVIKSKALYGRINLEMNLKGLKSFEAFEMLRRKRSIDETMRYLLTLGNVPKYLEEIDLSKSFEQNIERLCFNSKGVMVREFDRIFYNQFREAKNYLAIIKYIKDKIRSKKEISENVKIKSGGGLKLYLDNLEMAGFVKSYVPFGHNKNSKLKKYRLSDTYLSFYFEYIEPNIESIIDYDIKGIFQARIKSSMNIWLGFSFERFCLNNANIISRIMGFESQVTGISPYFGRKNEKFQIDLIYTRSDKVITICEIKFQMGEIGTKVIPEIERKCKLIKIPKGFTIEKALISRFGPCNSLRDADYFHHYVSVDDMFDENW